MTKYEIIKQIEEIDDQVELSKEVIKEYEGQAVPADSDIAYLCDLTVLLITEKLKLQKRLVDEYGCFLMN